MTIPEFWKKWKTPWKRDQCCRRYVEGGDEIGIRQLAKDSGQPKGTLERWSSQESWVDQRRQYGDNLRAVTQQKTVEKTSEKISDELSEIAATNYKIHRLARDYAASIFQIKAQHMQVVRQMPLEQQLDAIRLSDARELNYWSMIMSRATQGIAEATGLPYYIAIRFS